MISLTFSVYDVDTVMTIYDYIVIKKYTGIDTPSTPVDINYYTAVSGTDMMSSVFNTDRIILLGGYDQFTFYDVDGTSTDWYTSAYYSSLTDSYSAWADPVMGESGEIYYNPLYPAEVEYGSSEQLILSRLRLLIGDPVGLRREYGSEGTASIHPDLKTYEMHEKGWPSSVRMGNNQYTSTSDPSVNGYRYLRFSTTISGAGTGNPEDVDVDLWYYTFRYSDKELMAAYDNCPVPTGLTLETATSEAYMLQTAIDILTQNILEYNFEDGAKITDDRSSYDPSPGLSNLKDMLDALQKRLDNLVTKLMMTGITGYRLD